MAVHYIIDGYNLINHRSFSPLKKIKDTRVGLINLIMREKLCGSPNNRITVVFDGYPDQAGGSENYGFVDVLYSRDISADEKIKLLVESSRMPQNIIVVSDDKEIRGAVRVAGAAVAGVEEFLGEQKHTKPKNEDGSEKLNLNPTQMDAINEELKKRWLKE
ncbi:MAG: NYN domain-containing protein [Candidatus Omnitrophica bacterium]|nr:NYN domain-containing protein [Candidatus Omnitrophota bacterium]